MSAVCGSYGCEATAVGWVHFQALDGEGGVMEIDQDICGEHMIELEQEVEGGEAYIFEQIEYTTGSSWRESAEQAALVSHMNRTLPGLRLLQSLAGS